MSGSARAVSVRQLARRPSGPAAAFAASFGLLFAGLMVTILLSVAIWPGEVKLVAPLFCADDQPDAFVVSDTYSVQPGETTTNFTLYCMGPNGDATDHGFFLPFLATMGLNIAVMVAIGVVLGLIGRLRRGLRGGGDGRPLGPPEEPDEPDRPDRATPYRSGPPEGSTAGPFVE